MTEERKVCTGIDLFKLIAAILVVVLHTIETGMWYPCEVKYVFTRFAVPFFFITSGFFLCLGLKASDDYKSYFKKHITRLLKVFLVWSVLIYGVIEIIAYARGYQDVGLIKKCLMFIRRMFVIGPGPFWYLVALIEASCFIYVCYKHNKKNLLYIAMAIGFALEIGYSCFRSALSSISVFKWLFDAIYFVFSWEYNFIMFGIPFMGLGFIIADNGLHMRRRGAAVLFVASTLVRVFEYNIPKMTSSVFWQDNALSLAFIIQAYAFFMFAESFELDISSETSKTIRQLSSFTYFFHTIFLYEILNPLMNKYTNLPTYSGKMVAPKVVVVLAVCVGLFALIKKINNKYLNFLING